MLRQRIIVGLPSVEFFVAEEALDVVRAARVRVEVETGFGELANSLSVGIHAYFEEMGDGTATAPGVLCGQLSVLGARGFDVDTLRFETA